ncbi:hypothetical protein [Sphingomonas sp.]|uniref:hypothetical protein n=1 Tax=Sphingomonas sp. TaxID=28214 RepID=UPI00181A7320|nr:hypothetical protein [Sphingomonas sp.]MBA3512255.1 hypothetical protein [Sphingomonas sp.]
MKSTRLTLFLLAAAAPALGGCVAGMAASAISMAARSAQGQPASNQHLRADAERACGALAARHGTVQIIDVEQRTASRIIVWGTVDDGRERRSFQCSFGTRVTGFKLRAIKPRG